MRILLLTNLIYAFVLPGDRRLCRCLRHGEIHHDVKMVVIYQMPSHRHPFNPSSVTASCCTAHQIKRLYSAGMLFSGVFNGRDDVARPAQHDRRRRRRLDEGHVVGSSGPIATSLRSRPPTTTTAITTRRRDFPLHKHLRRGSALIGWFIEGTGVRGWFGGRPQHRLSNRHRLASSC